METKRDFGDRLRSMRKSAGLTIDALAVLANLSSQTIKDIEAGRRSGGLEAVIGLSRAFNMSIEALIGEDEPAVKKVLTISKLAQKISQIPDDVYDAIFEAGELNQQDWDFIKSIANNAKKRNQTKKEKVAKN